MLAATPLITIFAHDRPALGRDALEAMMDRALPFRREFAAFAQVPPHRLTVGHCFGFIRRDDYPLSTTLMAFLGSDETRRFAADVEQRHLQSLRALAHEIRAARQDLVGHAPVAGIALAIHLAPLGAVPGREDELAWTLWTARCRQRTIDPSRPPGRDQALADYQRFLIASGYAVSTACRWRARVQYLLKLLRTLPPPKPRFYATEIEILVDQLAGPSGAVSSDMRATIRCQIEGFARFLQGQDDGVTAHG